MHMRDELFKNSSISLIDQGKRVSVYYFKLDSFIVVSTNYVELVIVFIFISFSAGATKNQSIAIARPTSEEIRSRIFQAWL